MARMVVTVRAPAKINWVLRVLGRRADGYHEIESLVSTVSLADRLSFTARDDDAIEIQCDRPDLPVGEGNLVWQAVRLLAAEARRGRSPNPGRKSGQRTEQRARSGPGRGVAAGRHGGVTCTLVKRIPVGGGLGGGSSDAAWTLLALNRLWELGWPTERLLPLAAELGSDVPFLLAGGTAVIRGRGETVEPVRFKWAGWLVLLMPGIPIATARVYQAWRPGACPGEPLAGRSFLPADAASWMEQTYNMLEEPAVRVVPALGGLLDHAARIAGRPVRLSGSGSTMFTAFDAEDEARTFATRAREALSLDVEVVQPEEPTTI